MKNILYKALTYFGMFLVGVLLIPTSAFLLMIKLIWQCLDFLLAKAAGEPPQACSPPQSNKNNLNFTEPPVKGAGK